MKEEKLYRSLEFVRDEYLEDAADAMRRGRMANRFRRPRVWIIAACMVLAVTLISIPIYKTIISGDSSSPYYIPFGVDEIELLPSDMAGLFSASFLDMGGTKRYTKVTIDDPTIFELTNQEYLPVYEYDPTGYSLDQSEFEEFAFDRLERMIHATEASISMDELEVNYRELIGRDELYVYCSPDDVFVLAKQTPYHNLVRFGTYKGLYIEGKKFALNKDRTDEEIAKSVEKLSEKLFDIFDVSFQDTKIINQEKDGTIIIFYEQNAHPLNDLEMLPYSDYIEVFYTNQNKITIQYVQKRVPINELCGVVGKAKRISLEKAEVYLSQGYVFGGYHICPFCCREEENAQPLVDFTDYEYVNMEYVTNIFASEAEKKYIIPFYAFYKYIGDNDYGEPLYAKTYVPAIEVEGIAEYFSHKS